MLSFLGWQVYQMNAEILKNDTIASTLFARWRLFDAYAGMISEIP